MSASLSPAISLLYLVCGVLFFLLGLTILRAGRAGASSRATAMMLFFAGLGPLLSASGLVLELNPRAGSVVYANMFETFAYLWEFFFPSLMLFALSFPREYPVLRRYPVLALFVFLPYIAHLGVMMYGDRLLDVVRYLARAFPAGHEVSVGRGDVDVGGLDNVLGAFIRLLERAHRNFFVVVNVIYAAVAMAMLVRNRRDLVNPRVVRQVRTITIGVGAGVLCYAITRCVEMVAPRLLPENTYLALVNLSLLLCGGTIAYSVLRQQFLGIRNVLGRGLIYATVAALFALLYITVVHPVSAFFAQHSAASRDIFETLFIVLAIIAFQPALARTEEVFEKILFRGHVNVARRLRRLGDALSSVTTVEELEEAAARWLRENLDAASANLVLIGDADGPSSFRLLLEAIGEPVTRKDLQRLHETAGSARRRRVLTGLFRRSRRDKEMDESLRGALDAVVAALLDSDDRAYHFDVFVPLVREGICVGYIGLGEKIYGVPYSSEDLGYLSVLSAQIGTALQNVRLLRENLERKLFEEELKIARKIQTQLLPGDPPALDGFELSAVTVPSRYVGGDYYDFVVVEGRWLVIVVADVSGKGIPASILTASLQATVRSNADAQTDPERMMQRLNRLLYRNTSASEFATLFYAVVDLQTGRLRYSNAGHDFPFVVHSGRARHLEHSGIVLGCMEDFDYAAREDDLAPDTTLVVYTDGVTESQSADGEYFGTGRLQGVIERHAGSAGDLCRAVVDEVRAFGEQDRQDDLTLLVLKRSA